MQCAILAGGLGMRLGPLAGGLPKALVMVAGEPFAHHQLAWLAGEGVHDVLYLVGHREGPIKDYVGDGRRWGLSVLYSSDGEQLRGTAGALRLALDRGLLHSSFLTLYGDSFLQIQISPVWEAAADGGKAVMTVYRNDGAFDRSNVSYANGTVELYDKNCTDSAAMGMHYIDYGLSVLPRTVIQELVPSDKTMDLGDVFHRLSVGGRLAGFEVYQRFFEVGSPGGLASLDAHLRSKRNSAL